MVLINLFGVLSISLVSNRASKVGLDNHPLGVKISLLSQAIPTPSLSFPLFKLPSASGYSPLLRGDEIRQCIYPSLSRIWGDMEEANAYASAQRQFPQAFAGFGNDPAGNANFVAQLDPSLSQLDNAAATFSNQYAPQIEQAISIANTFPQRNGAPLQYQDMAARAMPPGAQQPQRQPQRQSSGQQQQLDMLASDTQAPAFTQQPAVRTIQQDTNNADDEDGPTSKSGKKEKSHFSGMKKILNPPDLIRWRQRLFDVEDTIVMTEEEYVSTARTSTSSNECFSIFQSTFGITVIESKNLQVPSLFPPCR